MSTRLRGVLAATAVALVGPAAVAMAGPPPPAVPDPCDWIGFRNGPTNPGATACDGIGSGNVASLAPRFVYRTRDSVTSTPAVVDGVLYVGAWDGTVYAFPTDASGVGDPSLPAGVAAVTPLWSTELVDGNDVSFGRIVSSPSVVDVDGQRLVLIASGATLHALRAADGAVLASTCLDPRAELRCQGSPDGEVDPPEIEVESSPVVVRNAGGAVDVVIGLDVHNRPGVGRTGVVRLRLTGGRRWAFHPVWKFDPEAGVAYTGDDLLTRGAGTGDGCGGVWGTAAVDVRADLVVFGTASCRAGSRFGERVHAVRFTTGEEVWRFSAHPDEPTDLDDDFGTAVQLFEADGRLVAGAGSKDGAYYALDAADGSVRWVSRLGQAGHVEEGFAIGGILGSPALGVVGGEQALFVTTAISVPDPSTAEDPGRMLSLHAISAIDGRVLWRSPVTRQTYAHPTYANGLVLVAATAGLSAQAFDADTGLPMWTSPPLNGPPSSGVAVTADGIYLGAGTRQSDAGYKLTNDDSPLAEVLGADPQERVAGVWGFRLAAG